MERNRSGAVPFGCPLPGEPGGLPDAPPREAQFLVGESWASMVEPGTSIGTAPEPSVTAWGP